MANSIGTPLTADDVLKALADLARGLAHYCDKQLSVCLGGY